MAVPRGHALQHQFPKESPTSGEISEPSFNEVDMIDSDDDNDGDTPYNPRDDQRDMRRLGKTQELKRRFRFFSIVGFVVVLGLTWPFSLVGIVFSLGNGGTAGAIWLTFVTCCGMCCVMLSMAEMASMAPTSGGQYHWVSEFAPRPAQKILSFYVGWLTALGWQAAMPTVAYVGAQQVLALVTVVDPEFAIQGWHGALLTMAFVLASILFNTWLIGKLPVLEGLAVVLHIFGFFAFITILWVMGPRHDAQTTLTEFEDMNGWGSVGLATLIGMVGPATTFIGGDSAVHLAEELKDASYVLPRAMASAAVINYILGFTTTVSLMFNLPDLDAALTDSSNQPYVAVIRAITGSDAATICLISLMIMLYFFCGVNQVTTSSRQVFAFARDKGLPFHSFLSRVRPSSGVPANSVYVTLVFTCALALIIIGSSLAFNIILTVCVTGLFTSYITCIACIILKRLRREQFPATKFSLGRMGLPINIMACSFITVAFVFVFFPAAPNPDPSSMNWGIVVYGGVLIFATIYYVLIARHHYEGPVNYVRWQTKKDLAD